MKIRILLVLFSFLHASVALRAQTYEAMWKEVDAAVCTDHPRTAIKVLESILQRAQREENEAQWLRASMVLVLAQDEISSDSAQVARERFFRTAKERSVSPRVPLAAQALWREVARRMRSADEQSLSTNWRALAGVSSAPYDVLFARGADSRKVFSDDVLSILVQSILLDNKVEAATRWRVMQEAASAYDEAKQEAAALTVRMWGVEVLEDLLWKVESEEELRTLVGSLLDEAEALRTQYPETDRDDRVLFAYYDALLTRYAKEDAVAECRVKQYDLLDDESEEQRAAFLEAALQKPAAADVKKALQGRQARLQQPYASFRAVKALMYPGTDCKFSIRSRHLSSCRLTLHRLDVTGKAYEEMSRRSEQLKTVRAEKIWSRTLSLPAAEPWRVVESEVTVLLPARAGIYRLTLEAAGCKKRVEYFTVSAVAAVQVSGKEDRTLGFAVDAKTGRLLKDASLQLCERSYRKSPKYTTPDALGEGFFSFSCPQQSNSSFYVRASHGADDFMPSQYLAHGWNRKPNYAREKVSIHLFTDRAIYRPLQTVQVGGVVHERHGEGRRVCSERQVVLKLLDTDFKTLHADTLFTDTMGCFSASFLIPEGGNTGYYHIEAVCDGKESTEEVRVEEYRRPTFELQTATPTETFALGDSLRLSATALTLDEAPVGGAKISWRLLRAVGRYWWQRGEEIADGTGITDASGAFSCLVALAPKPSLADEKEAGAFFTWEITATSPEGETHTTSLHLNASPWRARIENVLPESVCKEHPVPLTARVLNMQGEPQEASVRFRLQGTDKIITSWDALPSGRHTLLLEAEGCRTEEHTVVLFSRHDRRAPYADAIFWDATVPATASEPKELLVATSCKDATMYHFLFDAAGNVLSYAATAVSDSLLRFPLTYKPEMGTGATLCVLLYRDGKLYEAQEEILRPTPDTELHLEWESFRPAVCPGGKEEWRLRVKDATGRPVKANVMARMYDASLDAFAKKPWAFRIPSNLFVGTVNTRGYDAYNIGFATEAALPPTKDLEHVWTQWNPALFLSPFRSRMLHSKQTVMYGAAVPRVNATLCEAAVEDCLLAAVASSGGAAQDAEQEMALRQNFAETAFFFPTLRTDADGACSLVFTLPDALTRWNVNLLAFTRELYNGRLDATVVAQKDFTLRATLPRFVRPGDEAQVHGTLRNFTDRARTVDVLYEVLDARTHQRLILVEERAALEPSATQMLTFPLTLALSADVEGLLVRMTARGEGFSDGEEHLLPVLPPREEVERSIPFSLFKKGTSVIDLRPLYEHTESATRDTVEVHLVGNPIEFVAAALPSALPEDPVTSTEWAQRYYVQALGAHLLKHRAACVPDSVQAAAMYSLVQRKRSLEALERLQLSDGGWSWCEGMYPSTFLTVEVALNLVRASLITGEKEPACVAQAVKYLEREMREESERLKKWRKTHKNFIAPSETVLRYLYLQTLRGKKFEKFEEEFLADAEKFTDFTLFGKAAFARVFQHVGRRALAEEYAQSLLEHSVVTEEMGRYFDTTRAQSHHRVYRIPTQCMAIEALQSVWPQKGTELQQMRLWLMQCKRTQLWETSQTAMDAIYTLLTAPADSLLMGAETKECVQYRVKGTRLYVEKQHEGLSWGAVVRRMQMPVTEAVASEAGMSLRVRHLVKRCDDWSELKEGDALNVGDLVRTLYEISATRDFDFITLQGARPANLEPVQPLSGYCGAYMPFAARSASALPYYRSVRDASTCFYISSLAKGHHEIVEESRCILPGVYHSGLSRLRSSYAPEFSALAPDATVASSEQAPAEQ